MDKQKKTRLEVERAWLGQTPIFGLAKMPKNELSEKCPISYGHPKLAIMVQIRPYLNQDPN